MEKTYKTPTGKQLDERNFRIFSEKLERLALNGMYSPIGRLFCLCSKYENDARKKSERANKECNFDGIQKFFNEVLDCVPEKVMASSYIDEVKQKDLGKSLHMVNDAIASRELSYSTPLYHLCARAISEGYETLGVKLIEATKQADSKKTLRKTIVDRLLE